MVPQSSSARWLAGIGIGVAALAVASVLVTLLADSTVPMLDAGTPEGTVQRYVLLIDDGDLDPAYALLHADLQADCTVRDFRSQARHGRDADMTLRLDSIREVTDGTEVTVEVSSFSGSPPFDFSEKSYKAYFLVRDDGDGWRILDAAWPFRGCFQPPKAPEPAMVPPEPGPVAVD